jgi:glucan phosphoethanolaminetransferase (alkaline phosphatase superfamily)
MFGERPTFYRKTLGVLAIAVAIVAATAVWVQVADLVSQGAFVWFEYFSYFTIVTTVLNIVALLFGGFGALSSERDTILRTVARQSLVTYALISAGVYHLLLRDDLASSDAYVSADSWPMQIFHTYVPAYLVIDWLINPYRRRSPWSSMILVFVLPAMWLGFTLYRGQATGWYPYGFLNPMTEPGWSGVIQHVGVLALAIGVIQLLLLSTNRIFYGTKARQPARASR